MKTSCEVDPSLLPCAFEPLPLGMIRPAGWLLNQLRIQADGLSGHLDEFWPCVADSGWIGGQSEGWERGPYWLDGIVPLAYLLQDEKLIAKVRRWVDHILAHQGPDGWLGPVEDTFYHERQAYDPWPVFVALKALTQYHEATGDGRIIPAMLHFAERLSALLAEQPLFEWGRFRWADLVVSLHWLHARTGADWLLGLADTVWRQGYDWRVHFENFNYPDKITRPLATLATHVVNNAMAIKAPGVWFRQSRDPQDREAAFRILETLDSYHGQATGLFSGDEHYAGKNPSQGTELCAVVEYLFSLEVLVSVLGDVQLADRLERIAFNALPATFSPDMWAHQYDQQANQVICRIAEDRIYATNGPEANIFGLEPNYGCCTANMHQGWPKFAAHLWMRSPDAGLAAIAYAPSDVACEVAGVPCRIQVVTEYPFREVVNLVVSAGRPVRFPLHLRVPTWARGASVEIDGGGKEQVCAGTFYRLDRTWAKETRVTLHLPMVFTALRRYHESVTIERGPLVYSLRIGEDWRYLRGELPHADWEVYPTTPWNYALQLDVEHPETSLRLEQRPIAGWPFSPYGAPLLARARGRRLPAWDLEHNAAGPLPHSPVVSMEPCEELTLIPYGCSHLRITEFPLLA